MGRLVGLSSGSAWPSEWPSDGAGEGVCGILGEGVGGLVKSETNESRPRPNLRIGLDMRFPSIEEAARSECRRTTDLFEVTSLYPQPQEVLSV